MATGGYSLGPSTPGASSGSSGGSSTGSAGSGCGCKAINKLSELDAGGSKPPALSLDFALDLSKLPKITAPDELTIDKLTEVVVDGKGVFDVLMRATKSHLEQEHKKTRITGANYSEVYLASMQLAMTTALEFLTRGRKDHLELQVLQNQVLLSQVEVMKAKAQLAQILQQTTLVEAQTLLTQQQALNAAQERKVLVAQECKLRAEYDATLAGIAKLQAEIELLRQKLLTERAQVDASVIGPDSVIGKQNALYQAQTDGFARDAEQKVAKILVDTWAVRRNSDETVPVTQDNKLDDIFIGQAVGKLLNGIGL